MFWFCNPNNRNGFTVSKMICPKYHIFDAIYKECTIEDEIIERERNTRRLAKKRKKTGKKGKN